jgi:hypothetical protein
MTTFEFPKFKRPQYEGPVHKLPYARAAESEDQMSTENLSELLGRVSENSTSQIDDLVGDFGRLREKLRTDGGIQQTEPTGDATDEDHLRKCGESSSVSGSAPRGPQE